MHARGAREGRGEGRGRVDDQQVAGLEQVGQVEEAVMADPGPRGDQHPDVVALAGRLDRRDLEGQRGHAGATALAWYRPLGASP